MKELDAQQQLMVITMEECAELQTVCSKILRQGTAEYKQKELVEELGDVYCMIQLMQQWDLVSWEDIDNREQEKLKKLEKWSDLI